MLYMVFSINPWGSKFDNRGLDSDDDDGQGISEGGKADKPENAGQPAQRMDVATGNGMAPCFDIIVHLFADLVFDPSYVHGLAPSFVCDPLDGDRSTRGAP